MLNPPILIEHNNDFIVNGISLKCSPPRSSYQSFDKKNGVDFVGEDLSIK